MQTICTLLQTDNDTNTSSLNFYRPDAIPQITTPTPHHSVFYRPDAVPNAQPTMSEQKLKEIIALDKNLCISILGDSFCIFVFAGS